MDIIISSYRRPSINQWLSGSEGEYEYLTRHVKCSTEDRSTTDVDLEQALAKSYGTTLSPNQICLVCQNFIASSRLIQEWRSRWLRVSETIRNCQHLRLASTNSMHREQIHHFKSAEVLQASALKGCHVCSILYRARSESECTDEGELWIVETGHSEHPIRFQYEKCHSQALVELPVFLKTDPLLESFLKRLARGSLNGQEDNATEKILPSVLGSPCSSSSTHTGSEHALTCIEDWIQACKHSHEPCRFYVSPGLSAAAPTRLLEIQSDPLRLRIVDGQPRRPRYVAFSYRWGQLSWSDSSLLLQHNYAEWQESVRFAALPKTIQDVIYVAHQLGFTYLWIDRLCIIQDSESDFAREASNMGAYYANAALNIAALDAEGAADGFLTFRNSLALQPCRLEDLNLTLCTEEQLTLSSPPLSSAPKSSETHRHGLQSRGWVFQEEHLSRRTVYFGNQYIYWECRQHCATEPFVRSFPQPEIDEAGQITYKEIEPEKSRWVRQKLSGRMRISAADRYYIPDMWCRTVEEYSRRRLSKGSDRWRAIEGMATIMSGMSRNTDPWHTIKHMHHGLWDYPLSDNLMWKSVHESVTDADKTICTPQGDMPVHRRLPGNAPSWSWLSVSGPVQLYRNSKSSRVVHSLCSATFKPGAKCLLSSELPGVRARLHNRKIETLQISFLDPAGELGTGGPYNYTPDTDVVDNEDEICLIAVHRLLNHKVSQEPDGICGLVIKAVDKDHNHWIRCGLFWGVDEVSWPSPPSELLPVVPPRPQRGWALPWLNKVADPAQSVIPENDGPGRRAGNRYELLLG